MSEIPIIRVIESEVYRSSHGGLVGPCTEGDNWFKGNLHAYPVESDGARSVQDVIADYETRVYDFRHLRSRHVRGSDDYPDRTQMALLPAVEVSANGLHVHHVDPSEVFPPVADRQTAIEEILDGRGMAILNHPNWQLEFSHWTQDQLNRLNGYDGIEISNGLVERHPVAAVATDR